METIANTFYKFNMILSYYKLRKFKRGITISIEPTFRCNQTCSYCINKNFGDKLPRDKDPMNYIQWLNYIDKFPLKIGEISIGGGEPTLYPRLSILINILLHKGFFVQLFTNLTHPEIINRIDKSIRFRVIATYHEGQIPKDTFLNNLKILKHPVQSQAFVDGIPVKRKINFWDLNERKNLISCLRISPDGTIFTNCYDLHKFYL